jgi:uncharacterized surface protein with fasciclin (FAS1) repeats
MISMKYRSGPGIGDWNAAARRIDTGAFRTWMHRPLRPDARRYRTLVRSCSKAAHKRGSITMHNLKFGAAIAFGLCATVAVANPMVGGAPMYSTRNIVQNAVNSKDHTTLVAAVKAGGLVDTLSGKGPFTVFAPTNAAFARLPAGTVETLVKPENKAMLDKILTYHVVPGRITAQQIAAMAARRGGTATLKTVEGEPLKFVKNGTGWAVIDTKGNRSRITIANVMQSNGVIHVVDAVLMP